jgi:hypothetical protein
MKKIGFLLCLCFICFFSFGQWKQSLPTTPSPAAAALGTFTELPVSYFTGTPNISIPLYTVKGSSIELPVSLNYHPAVRPDYHPGWTGIGWTLICGGAITRKQNSRRDEEQATYTGYTPLGYYFQYSFLNNSSWATNVSNNQVYPQTSEWIDIAPDEFSFNFLGFSGKFFLDHTGQWRVQSDKAFKVVFNPADFINPFFVTPFGSWISESNVVTKTFKKFVLIDEAGNKYTFGDSDKAIEYSDIIDYPPVGMGKNFTATSWYLTKIESADGTEMINLNYVRGPFNSVLTKNHFTCVFGTFDCTYTPDAQITQDNYGRVISPVYLSYIEMPKHSLRIDFIASKCNDLQYNEADYRKLKATYLGWGNADDYNLLHYNFNMQFDVPTDATILPTYKRFIWRKLDGISILNSSTNEIVKKIAFNYREQATARLRLSALNIKDGTDNTIQPYTFTYNDAVLMPAYLSKVTDHWGFNNNADYPPNFDFSVQRQPNESYSKAEILKEIFYPTGGSNEFQFETNKYASIVSQDRLGFLTESGNAGGLRIRKIITKDGINTPLQKEFFYIKNHYCPTKL